MKKAKPLEVALMAVSEVLFMRKRERRLWVHNLEVHRPKIYYRSPGQEAAGHGAE